LYLTLKRQTESNDNQRLKNDADLVFLLYNQLEAAFRETSQVTTKHARFEKAGSTSSSTTHYGFEAFQQLCSMFTDDFAKNFPAQNEASKILFIIQSYKSLDELLNISKIEENLKGIIERKAHNFYLSRMRDPLANLAFHIRGNKDEYSNEAIEFFTQMEKRKDKNFDLYSFANAQDLFPKAE